MCLTADTAFIRTYGGVNFEEFRDIVQTPDSGFMMAGITNGYGQGSNAIYVVKTTKNGTHVWSKAIGGVAADLAYSISADQSGKYYIAGTSSSGGNGGYDGYLVCLDITGTILWEKYYGGIDWDFLNSVAVLPDESILLAGESYSFSSGGSDAWVLHLNNVGDTLWTKHFGSTGNDAFKNINIGPTAIYLSGYVDSTDLAGKDGYLVKLDFSGSEYWEQRHDNLGRDELNGSVFEPGGNIIIYGSTAVFDSTKNDIWVEKIDTNGVSMWLFNSGEIEDDYANKVIPIRNNDLVIVGEKNPSGFGNKSLFTALLDGGGWQKDSHSFGGPNDEEGYSGVRTIEGGIAFVGYTTSYGVANKDAMLIYLRNDSTITGNLIYNTNIFIETLSPIGINEFSKSNIISIFPNPATAQITIQTIGSEKISSITLYNFIEQNVYFQEPKSFSDSKVISTSELPKGVYLLKVILTDKREFSGRIIIID